MEIGDRGYFGGFSVVIEDIMFKECQTKALVRYVATNRTEWVPLSSVTR